MKKHHLRKIVCLLLALLIIGSTLSATAFAAAGDTLDSLAGASLLEGTPNSFQFLRNNTEGTVTKEINESGFYQRLPRNTQTCPSCGGVLVELTPDYFAVPSAGSYVLSDPSVLGDCSFSLEYSKFSGYTTSPCLQFNYTAKRPGTTTVTLTFYYNYNYPSETGNCSFCGQRVQTLSQTTWYQETTTFTVTVLGDTYTVTYTDGVDGEEIFPDQVYTNLLSGDATPEFVGTPTREGYVFAGWNPEVAETVTDDATYTAVWKEDRNNNGIPDEDEDKYTVTYTDGVDGVEIFPDQVYTDLLFGDAIPEFVGTPAREGYVFAGWNPEVTETVTDDATYTAVWKEDRNNNGIPDEDEDKYTVTYTDGVDGVEIFPDQVYTDLLFGDAIPEFVGTPAREGYVFAGWNPEVTETVTDDATYTAVWKEDRNNNGIPDEDEDKYTVTYTDGVDGEEIFPDQVYTDLLFGDAIPEFVGTPTREGYVFAGWNAEVTDTREIRIFAGRNSKAAETVTGNATYTAVWKEDRNNNGIPDEDEDKYTVTYTDGVDGEEIFPDQVYTDLLFGDATPEFVGIPTREGYVFAGWSPEVAETVTGDVNYVPVWEKVSSENPERPTDPETPVTPPDTGDSSMLWIPVVLLTAGLAFTALFKKKSI